MRAAALAVASEGDPITSADHCSRSICRTRVQIRIPDPGKFCKELFRLDERAGFDRSGLTSP